MCSNSADKQIPFRECLNSQSPRQYRHKFRSWAMSNINIDLLGATIFVTRSQMRLSIKNRMQSTRSLYDIRFKSYGSIGGFHVFGDL